jgi:putative oxidoreductase
MNRTIKALIFGGPGSSTVGDIGLLLLRALGLMISVGHGWGKMFHAGGFGPTQQFVQGVRELGLPAPTFLAWCAALAEFVGGLLIAAGLLTRPMALMLTINMLVAILGVHLNDPLFMTGKGGAKEPALLYLIPFVALLFTGPGRFSLDWLLFGDRSSKGRGFDVA